MSPQIVTPRSSKLFQICEGQTSPELRVTSQSAAPRVLCSKSAWFCAASLPGFVQRVCLFWAALQIGGKVFDTRTNRKRINPTLKEARK